MGAFLSANKNGYYPFLLSYLADKNVYLKDQTLIPYTPSRLQTYVDFYPELYNPALIETLSLEINGTLIAQALVNHPAGMVYANIPVPKGKFRMVTRRSDGEIIKIETYNAKNFAMFVGAMAQSYNERLTEINATKADQRFSTIRTGRLYPVLGVMFGFVPPAGWPNSKYRAAILGGCGPGFTSSFFDGATKKGVEDTIESITCQAPVVLPPRRGVRWSVRSSANSNPNDPSVTGFFVRSLANTSPSDPDLGFVAPHHRVSLASLDWWSEAVDIQVPGSERTVGISDAPEEVHRQTESYLQASLTGPFDLQGRTLQFSIEEIGDPTTKILYNTVFPLPTTDAALAAAAILAANPSLTSAIYASADGHLRIGVSPQAGKMFRITITAGNSLDVLGLALGDTADVKPDQLDNPFIKASTFVLTDGVTTFVDGVDFNLIPETGQIVWLPSTALNMAVPAAGTTLGASYTYQMRREIVGMVDKVRDVNSIVRWEWLP